MSTDPGPTRLSLIARVAIGDTGAVSEFREKYEVALYCWLAASRLRFQDGAATWGPWDLTDRLLNYVASALQLGKLKIDDRTVIVTDDEQDQVFRLRLRRLVHRVAQCRSADQIDLIVRHPEWFAAGSAGTDGDPFSIVADDRLDEEQSTQVDAEWDARLRVAMEIEMSVKRILESAGRRLWYELWKKRELAGAKPAQLASEYQLKPTRIYKILNEVRTLIAKEVKKHDVPRNADNE